MIKLLSYLTNGLIPYNRPYIMEQQKINARVIKFLIRRISKDTPFSLMSRRPAVGADWLDGKSLNPRYMFLRC